MKTTETSKTEAATKTIQTSEPINILTGVSNSSYSSYKNH